MNATLTTFREYVRASRHLAEALRVNRQDSNFVRQARECNEIFYVFDANIVVNYVQREHGAVSGPLGTSALFTPTGKELNGELTLRYLFSGRLPGQRLCTAYLSPSHWDEALNLLHRGLARDAVADGSSKLAATVRTLDETLRPILQTLESIKDPRDLFSKAEASGIPQQLLTWVANYVTTNLRADSVFRGAGSRPPSIQDLNNAQTYWPAAMNSIMTTDYRFWIRELRKAWNNIERHEAGKRERNIDFDAYTLAAMQALHRQNPISAPPHPKVRFVFVTANRAIIRAVRENLAELAAEGIPNFLRHPGVYTPLLNYSAMFAAMNTKQTPNDEDLVRARSVFDEVERTLKSLLPADAPDEHAGRSARTKHYEPDIADNIRLWSQTADQLSTINIRYFFDDVLHLSEASRQIAQLLSDPDILVAGAAMISHTLVRIRSDHVRQVSAVVLQQLATVAGSHVGDSVSPARAVPNLIGVDLLAPLGDLLASHDRPIGSLGDLLDLIRGRGSNQRDRLMPGLIAELEKSWDDPNRFGEAQLLATCIYAAVGAWESAYFAARFCAERTGDLSFIAPGDRSRMGIIRREADYCKSLAVRFTLRSRSEFEAAENVLASSIARQVLTLSLATPRDKSELAALMLTASILQVIEKVTPNQNFGADGELLNLIDDDAIRRKFDDAVTDMRATLENFENFENLPLDRNTPHRVVIADSIRLQLATNLLGAVIFSFILPRGMLSHEIATNAGIEAAMRQLRTELSTSSIRRPPPTSELYLAAGEFLTEPSPAAGETLKRRIVDMRAGALHLSHADKAELGYIERHVNAKLVPRPTPTYTQA